MVPTTADDGEQKGGMTYQQAVAYLEGLPRFVRRPGLARIRRLLAAMGDPQLACPAVHVAGTNGKGSVTAMVAAGLNAAGVRAGMYTSPHLSSYCQRWQLAGHEVAAGQFAGYVARVAAVAHRLAPGLGSPTAFEVLTAGFFAWLADQQGEYAVVEAGLGGLYDPTNLVRPSVTVITNIGYDHCQQLGNRLTAIARHKAGIIKPRTPVITAASGDGLTVVGRKARRVGARVMVLGRDWQAADQGWVDGRRRLAISGLGGQFDRCYRLALAAPYQVTNAGLAIAAYRLLAAADRRLSAASLSRGLDRVSWFGRFTIIGYRPLTIVDGAHNLEAARELRNALDQQAGPGPRVLVVAGMADKPLAAMMECLLRPVDLAISVPLDNPRALTAAELAAICARFARATACSGLGEGLAEARRQAGEGGVVVITGSLYLAGELAER
ncbi:MAG: bifunctional folylpolyglutamate synthase/dihydrofolate synthase [Negativicutes bacterium]|nr:bifunctional folylpolyglutamate synthase/dihydrofolate synthase [Negativicutes bacterium]